MAVRKNYRRIYRHNDYDDYDSGREHPTRRKRYTKTGHVMIILAIALSAGLFFWSYKLGRTHSAACSYCGAETTNFFRVYVSGHKDYGVEYEALNKIGAWADGAEGRASSAYVELCENCYAQIQPFMTGGTAS